MSNYSESELIFWALKTIKKYPQGIETKDLIQILRLALDPSGEDLEILTGRSDDKFSQKVRNLKSHKTLENKGLAKFFDNRYYITDEGIKYLDNSKLKKLSINIHEEWPLTVRLSNALKNQDILFVGDLVICEPSSLLSFTNFGKTSLEELKGLMKENNISWNTIYDDDQQWFDQRAKLLNEIKNKKDKGLRLDQNIVGKKSLLKDFKDFTKITSIDKIFIDLETPPEKLSDLIIEDISEIISLLNDKMSIIFKGRFGYRENYKTLEELGKEFGITRERVRQLEFKLKRSLKNLGKIEKNSLIDYFNKYETVSFHKLFPRLNKHFSNTARDTGEISKNKLTHFIECYCGVRDQYFKTTERELLDFDTEKLREIFTITPSGISKDNFLEIIKNEYGYNQFTAKSALEYLDQRKFIKIIGEKIYPIKMNKVEEVIHILLDYPEGLHWKKICEIGNNSFTKNKWDLNRLVADSSFSMKHNPYIYLSDKGEHKLVKYLLKKVKDKDQLILKVIDILKNSNKEQCSLEQIYTKIIQFENYKNFNFYELRGIIKIFGEDIGLYHSGKFGQNTISINKKIKTISLKDKIKEIVENSKEEISYQEINKKLQKSNEQLPLSHHLIKLEDENVIFKINPGIYLNFEEALKLCDNLEVEKYLDKVLDNYKFITNVFIREKINEDLGYNLSTSYYSSLVKVLAKKNNWFCDSNYLSKKEKKMISINKFIENNYEKDLSINDNFTKIRKKIGVSKTYYDNVINQNNNNFDTNWIYEDN